MLVLFNIASTKNINKKGWYAFDHFVSSTDNGTAASRHWIWYLNAVVERNKVLQIQVTAVRFI